MVQMKYYTLPQLRFSFTALWEAGAKWLCKQSRQRDKHMPHLKVMQIPSRYLFTPWDDLALLNIFFTHPQLSKLLTILFSSRCNVFMEALSAQIGYKCSWNLLKLFWIPAAELIHSGQGCNAFTEGCSMGGLDPNKFLCSVSSNLEWIHLKK